MFNLFSAIARRSFVLFCVFISLPLCAPSQQVATQDYAGLRWRMIGPYRGGRSNAVTGIAGQPGVYYFGAVGGGVWKSVNAGETWVPMFDSQRIASIGALAVAPSNPDIVYAGTGEADFRSDLSYGNGLYRSADGGKTWRNIGLRDSRHIARILIYPKNPDSLLVAALGDAYGPSAERGVYRTTDG
ncbi:MAG: WD40/YVTN/BNR-like repeat-containing protein, partial [Candidatus Angelobacter sp.]